MSDAGTFVPAKNSRPRQILGLALGLLVVVALAFAVSRNWEDFIESWSRIGLTGAVVALGLGVVNAFATWVQWRAVLGGLGVRLEAGASGRVFFLSQLGKYVPGSVWPVVLQVESSHRHGADRKSVIAGNAVVLTVSLTIGLLIAALLVPFSAPSALARFWWALAALPILAVALHPSTLPRALDLGLRRLGKQPLGVRLSSRVTLQAMGWSTVAWLAIGGQTAVLSYAMGARGDGLVALCVGGTALAVSAGILFLPAPAGAGAREVVLIYVLATELTTGAALAVAVASRVFAIGTDLLVAAASAAAPRRSTK